MQKVAQEDNRHKELYKSGLTLTAEEQESLVSDLVAATNNTVAATGDFINSFVDEDSVGY